MYEKTLYTVMAGLIMAALLTGVLLSQENQNYQKVTVTQDFENGLGDWVIGSHVPDDPNNSGQKVNYALKASDNQSYTGNKSTKLSLYGSQDDGTVWLQRNPNACAQYQRMLW